MAKSIRPGAGTGSSQHIQQASSNKGVPWSDEEHKAFLLGLQHVGKGNWRVISRQYVKTRTPTQVASHAQKYFLREAGVSRRRSRFAEVEEALSQDQQLDGSSQSAKRACRAPNTGTATTNSDASHQDAHGVHITGTLSHAGLSSVDNSHGSTVREPGSPSKGSSGAASASPPCSMFPCPPFMFGFPGAPGFMPALPFVCGPMSMPLPVANMAAAAAAAAITKAMCSAGQSSGKPGSPMQMQMPIGAFPFPFPPPSFVMAQMAHMAGQMAAASQAANGVVANTDPAAAATAAAAGPCSRSAGRNAQQHQDKQEQQQRGRGVLIEGELYCEEGSGYAVRGHGAPEQDACDDEHGDAMGRSVRQLGHANDFACSLMMLAGAAGEELQERQQEQRAASCSAAMVCSPAGSNQCDAGAGSGPESHDDDPRVTVAASASRLCKPEACWASAADANTAGSSTRAILEQLAVVKTEQADTAQLTRGSTGYSDSLSPVDGGAMAMSGSGCSGLFGSWPSAGATGMQHGWCNGALRVSQHSAFHPLPRASQSPTVA